ncbi:hypothetical protein B0H17DRAFT_1214036 [Mycena rosella]|uniref:Uncharacterized protein n=1 Tax=Mycena rosella TaxID=1033263 RepID=A0AAD7G1E4_MYCRO|nr:hypothetical protein B0H17DRAFT_1214036 [Mycena rosella]
MPILFDTLETLALPTFDIIQQACAARPHSHSPHPRCTQRAPKRPASHPVVFPSSVERPVCAFRGCLRILGISRERLWFIFVISDHRHRESRCKPRLRTRVFDPGMPSNRRVVPHRPAGFLAHGVSRRACLWRAPPNGPCIKHLFLCEIYTEHPEHLSTIQVSAKPEARGARADADPRLRSCGNSPHEWHSSWGAASAFPPRRLGALERIESWYVRTEGVEEPNPASQHRFQLDVPILRASAARSPYEVVNIPGCDRPRECGDSPDMTGAQIGVAAATRGAPPTPFYELLRAATPLLPPPTPFYELLRAATPLLPRATRLLRKCYAPTRVLQALTAVYGLLRQPYRILHKCYELLRQSMAVLRAATP